MSKISVLMITKNREQLFQRSLSSALAQVDIPEEVVIVDNSDSFWVSRRKKKYAKRLLGSRLIWKRSKLDNLGLLRDLAIKSMKSGDYFTFLDDDDVISPDFLLTAKFHIFRSYPDMVVTYGEPTSNSYLTKNVLRVYRMNNSVDVLGSLPAYSNWKKDKDVKLYNDIGGKVIRKSLYDQLPESYKFRDKTYEDLLPVACMILSSNKILRISNGLYYTTRDGNSVTQSNSSDPDILLANRLGYLFEFAVSRLGGKVAKEYITQLARLNSDYIRARFNKFTPKLEELLKTIFK